jgi:hypothetical protein
MISKTELEQIKEQVGYLVREQVSISVPTKRNYYPLDRTDLSPSYVKMDLFSDIPKLVEALGQALEVIRKIDSHGCCVMHNDSGCPGCRAREFLKEFEGGDE